MYLRDLIVIKKGRVMLEKIIYFFRKKQATSDFCAIMLYYEKVRCIKRGE